MVSFAKDYIIIAIYIVADSDKNIIWVIVNKSLYVLFKGDRCGQAQIYHLR